MNILVIGGAGFIGQNLISELIKCTSNHIICIDNLLLGSKEGLEKFNNNNNFSFYEIDASVKDKLSNIFRKEKPDIVYHLAANSDIRLSATDPDIDKRNTFETTQSILNCMRDFNVKKLFFASTSAVYGDKHDEVLNEITGGLMPISYYGGYKMASEALIYSYSYMNNFESIIFRFPNVVGPNLTHGVIYDFITRLKKDSSVLNVLGDGTQDKQYIYIDDLINAIMLCTNHFKQGTQVYNVGTESSTTVKKIAELVLNAMSLEKTIIKFSEGNTGWKGDVPRFKYDLSKIHCLGWKAKNTSDEAIKLTIEKFLGECKS